LVIPDLGVGGMERVLAELADYFYRKPETEVHIIMYSGNREIYYPISNPIKVHIPDFKFNKRFRIWFSIRTLFFLRKEIKSINPTSILSFGELWNSFVLLSLMGLKFPVYISDRCKPDKSFGLFHNMLRKWLYPKATGIIAQTTIAKKIYLSQFKHHNITVIGNPIRQIIQPDPNKLRENIVLSVGRLIPTKHHDLLIDMFLRIDLPDWKLIIIGDNGPTHDIMGNLKRKITKKQAEGKVILTGDVSNVEEYYKKSKVFAFTSSSEGFPNVIGEAMSAGLPVVAFDCMAGPSEMIEKDSTGFLIPLFDLEQFERKLRTLMDDEDLRNKMSKNAEEKIKKFSIDKIGEQYYSFLTEHD
jgi:GalNAc-alpha-(1->4)-GalNAc-alpha-(1->3)-diNAcBac-PP-undecaprenol alpha-1,4-N-acetyl-D-galactosaminyltransferase